jgi:excisionase family DNA binding protein
MGLAENLPADLSAAQAARQLGVSLRTVRCWADLGYLPAHEDVNGQRRFSEHDIEKLQHTLRRRVDPLSPAPDAPPRANAPGH